jgi:hypothetical protein
MIECIFGWGKQHGTMRKTKHRGIRGVAADFMLNLIAYNLIRIPKLIAASAGGCSDHQKAPRTIEHTKSNDPQEREKNFNFKVFPQTASLTESESRGRLPLGIG